MSVHISEEAVKAKDIPQLLTFLSLITQGLQEALITQDVKAVEAVDPDLKKRVTVLAISYMKRCGDKGKSQFLSEILVPALGTHKTFVDCTDEDFRLVEAKLLEQSDA
ncbi:hypothetical protein PSGCA5_29 [Liberibacter phage SGCA5-1]|uniref:Uncharacterized protein n=1 Tax=Liberibacter phage SGCA5-1 TaxID=1903184 RepID=A0A1L2JZ14_9CAUD|nr:hypothetical protein PSGCA5_29 [Liberibacter phage SGCA5-1]